MSIVTVEPGKGLLDMLEPTTSSPRMFGAVVAAAALLAAGLSPVVASPEIGTRAVASLSADIALASTTVADGLADAIAAFDIPGAAAALDIPGPAAAFDIAGLINAEFAAAQGLFNHIFSLPVTLFNDAERLFTSLVDLNFGQAFSELFAIPQDIVNYVLGLPGTLINTVYEMAVVLPGEFLFNFG